MPSEESPGDGDALNRSQGEGERYSSSRSYCIWYRLVSDVGISCLDGKLQAAGRDKWLKSITVVSVLVEFVV